ncbi:hypothetical protein ACWGS9_19935 [Bradyrhizobium sp. Arg314]
MSAGISFAANDRIERAARWLVEHPVSQHPAAEIFASVMRDHFKLSTVELIAAVKEADRLRHEGAGA